MTMLCTREWLRDHLDDARVRIFDCSLEMRFQPVGKSLLISGFPDWQKAHVPGSRYLSLPDDLSAPEATIPYGLPPIAQVQQVMRSHGVNEGDTIVLLGQGYLGPVVRIWWVLTASGARDVRILDGGLEGWREAGLPLTDDPGADPAEGDFIAHARPELRADAESILAGLEDPGAVLVNALSPEQFTGAGGAHYGRPGRIPGSVSVPFRDLLQPGSNWFRPEAEIRAIFEAAGVLQAPRIVSYCGGGIAASGTSFALHLIGRGDAALYDGSLTDWAADPSHPMVTGEAE